MGDLNVEGLRQKGRRLGTRRRLDRCQFLKCHGILRVVIGDLKIQKVTGSVQGVMIHHFDPYFAAVRQFFNAVRN